MRPLTLHVSALSDLEYNLYTASLDDLSVTSDTDAVHDDGYYERMTVGVREARAWLRGRYLDLPASDIDAILKLFHPNMLPSDSLTGGQFFAALRLVVHADTGEGVDRMLAFVQGESLVAFTVPSASVVVMSPYCTDDRLRAMRSRRINLAHPDTNKVHVPRPVSPRQPSIKSPPSHPDRRRASTSTSTSHELNPFAHRSVQQATPLPSPSVDFETVPMPRRHSQKISHNPFLMRDKVESGESAATSAENSTTKNGRIPPLPPRKPTQLSSTSARCASEATPLSPQAANSSTLGTVPHVPAKLGHVMSPLMRQSLEASKHGQTMKRAEEQLERERILQVLKSTSPSSSGTGRTRSSSPSKKDVHMVYSGSESEEQRGPVPPLPRRHKPSPPSSSTSSSLPSLDQVASATLKPLSSQTTNSPLRPPLPRRNLFVDTDDSSPVAGTGPMPAPPMHPDRRLSNGANDSQSSSPTFPGVSRSKTVHCTTATATPPLPPPRRKRPESVQLTLNSSTNEPAEFTSVKLPYLHSRTSSFQGLSRHLSLTRDRDTTDSSSPMSNIQKTITNLQLKAQPRLEAARYKAEAGLSKRGYVNPAQFGGTRWREESEEGLISDTRWTADPYSESTTDDDPDSGDERVDRLKSGTSHSDVLTGADNLKWPAGEGWKPL
ncbi:hypothetical protein F5I97DRAFT_462945 [Phlebopus sp. FC_14]|nr:hypothetical protein F5I97DRAFT_462945 [Phlebopus sp. FC_14]